MSKYVAFAVLSLTVLLFAFANAQPQKAFHPGAELYTPTRIDWLTTTLQASLRDEQLDTKRFLLQIASPDSETIMIYVRYFPDVNREAMNVTIDSARKVIQITAKSYGWDKWVKIREDVQLAEPQNKN